ncbi:MAG TPA: carboxypeptidase-like regulatory domain-containing protein [Pirellulaceae bacterium]|nr:carboxypeptidase-like regulatory domain-containing protein [Pirellulaceae bacterium]
MNRWLLALLSLMILTGCGPSVPQGVIVTGKLTKGGTPLAGAEDGTGAAVVTIVSVAKAEDGSSSGGQAATDASGAFRIVAGGRGVPPGKYRIHLEADAGPGQDLFGGAYSGINYLKEVEVPADKMGGEFDLGSIELDDNKPMSVAPPEAATP